MLDLTNRAQRWQLFIFILLWTAYAATLLLRRPLGLIKSDLESEFSLTKYQLGLLDTAFLLPYAGVQTFLGSVGDRYGVRNTITLCLLVSATSVISFSEWQSFQMFLLLLCVNGAAQSLAWPTSIKGIGEWFPSSKRNTVFGFFGTCTFAGGIVGTVVAVNIRAQYGWQNVYQIPSIIVACIGVIVFISFRKPSEVDIKLDGDHDVTGISSQAYEKVSKRKPISWAQQNKKPHSKAQMLFRETWNIPLVTDIVYASFSINFVRYCLFMWLPMYLSQHLHYSTVEAGLFSTSFEIGGIVGCVTIGFVIDRFLRGQSLLGCSLYILLSAASLFLFHLTSTWGRTFNIACIFLTGVFNCGVDTIMTGSVPTKLGTMDGRNAGAAISGIVNGFGKISTMLQGPIIGLLAELYGWSGVLVFLILVSVLGSIVTFKASRKMQSLSTTIN